MAAPSNKRILLVEDNPKHLALYVRQLEQESFDVVAAANAEEAFERMDDEIRVVVTDMYLPGVDGDELMARLHQTRPGLPVIILTNQGRVEESLELIRRGAFDYIQKTKGFKDFLLRVARAVEHAELAREVRRLRTELDQTRDLVPSSDPRMLAVLKRVHAVAATPYPVLVTGESGTGKEVIARQIHRESKRAEEPFVTVNCGAIPRDLFESELFGHVRGSFTGATADRSGLFEEADGGFLFLDEVGEIAPEHQVKLLRALQEGEVKRVGDSQSRQVDVRVLAATNRDLRKAVRQGKFREDLFYRIHVMPIELPPLRERTADILPLAQQFLDRGRIDTGRNVSGFSRDAADALRRYPWPGNIRELENKIRQALIVCAGSRIEADDLPLGEPFLRDETPGHEEYSSLSLVDARQKFEKRYLTSVLQRTGGNVSKAAEEAGKHRSEFYYLLNKHSINPADYRPG